MSNKYSRSGVRQTMLSAASAMVLASLMPAAKAADDQAVISESGGLDEVTVTARRKSENLRDVPEAVSVVQGEQLADANITQLIDFTEVVPSFQLSYGSVNPYTFIRGFGSGGSPSLEQSVGKFVDNVSFGHDQDGRVPLFDIERVEVLKGPQVLLYGNSTTAGALNITTKKPGASFEGDGSVSYEFNAHEPIVQGGVTVPLDDNLSLRVAGLYQNLADGWVHNGLTDRNETETRNAAGRATLRYVPTDSLEVVLKIETDQLRDTGGLLQPYVQATSRAAAYPEIGLNNIREVNTAAAPYYAGEFADMDSQLYQGDISYDVLGGTLNSTTSFRTYHTAVLTSNDAPVPSFEVDVAQRYRQIAQELRYTGTFGKSDITIGGYYEHNNLDLFTVQSFDLGVIGVPAAAGGLPFGRVATLDQSTSSSSVFADETYHLTEDLSVEAGLRFSHITKDAAQSSNPANIVPGLDFNSDRAEAVAAINRSLTAPFVAITNTTPHSYTGLSLNEYHTQPQAVLKYNLNATDMVYAKYVHGAKVGGFDYLYGGSAAGATPGGAQFRPEAATSYEVGIKGVALDHRISYGLDAYTTSFQSLQVSVFNGTSFLVSNVGRARTRGFEGNLDWKLLEGLTLEVNGAYLDAAYLDFPGATCTPAQAVATPAGKVCQQNLSGTPTQYAARWSGNIGLNYRTPIIGGSYTADFGASVVGKTRYNAGSTNDPLQEQGAYAQLDAHVDLIPALDWWTVSVFGRNLTDKQYLQYAVGAPAVKGAIIGARSRGRQVGLRLSAAF